MVLSGIQSYKEKYLRLLPGKKNKTKNTKDRKYKIVSQSIFTGKLTMKYSIIYYNPNFKILMHLLTICAREGSVIAGWVYIYGDSMSEYIDGWKALLCKLNSYDFGRRASCGNPGK